MGLENTSDEPVIWSDLGGEGLYIYKPFQYILGIKIVCGTLCVEWTLGYLSSEIIDWQILDSKLEPTRWVQDIFA